MSAAAKPRHPRRRASRALIITTVVLALAGGGYYAYQTRTSSTAAQTTSATQTVTVTRGNLRVSVDGPGVLTATTSQAVIPKANGTIQSLPTVGQTVTKGDLIATLDEVPDAHRLMESNQAKGKLAVLVTVENERA